MKKRNILYILISNLLIIFFLFSIFETQLEHICKNKYPQNSYRRAHFSYKEFISDFKYRPVIGKDYKKRPIILLGCSYAYGYQLEEKDTIGYKIAKIAKRPVYNYSITGKGLQNTLFQLENDIYSNEIKDPEYAIYILMNDQIRRIYSSVNMTDTLGQPEYKLTKDGELRLKYNSNPIYKQYCTYYFINNLLYNYFFSKLLKRNNKYVNAYFKAINKKLKEKYPNIKLVIIIYGNKWDNHYDFSELEKENITILHTIQLTGTDLFQRPYWQADNDMHPNGAAWDLVVPKLNKKLNL